VGPGGAPAAEPAPAAPAAAAWEPPAAVPVKENAYGYPAAAPAAPAAAAPAYDAPYGRGSGLSSNSYAQGSNQNAGNVLTDRRITKVLAPPGGRSQITFG